MSAPRRRSKGPGMGSRGLRPRQSEGGVSTPMRREIVARLLAGDRPTHIARDLELSAEKVIHVGEEAGIETRRHPRRPAEGAP